MNLMTPFQAGVNAQQPPLLIVTGQGRVDVVPDTAVVSLGVTTRAQQATPAFQQTAARLNQVVSALLAAGIPRDQIQTTRVSLSPAFEDSRQIGFDATATVRVTLQDLGAVGSVIDRAVAAGANTVNGVDFELRDPATAQAAALVLAVQDAQRQAQVLARSAGVTLGPVFRVTAEPPQVPVPIFAAQAAPAAARGIPVLPGTINVTRNVQVEFLIGR